MSRPFSSAELPLRAHGARETYPALTGLRAVLATLVILLHIRPFLDLGPLQTLVEDGGRAVDVFFVLSGFILFHTYAETFAVTVRRNSYFSFLQNRLARIYPVHLATLAIGIALFVASMVLAHKVPREVHTVQAPSLIANLALVHAWFSGLGSPNSPSWSISAEWFAYLFCPFLILILRRAQTAWLSLGLVAALLLPDVMRNTVWHSDIVPPSETVAGWDPLVRIARAFSVGAIVYVLGRRLRIADHLPGWLAPIFAGLMIANPYVFENGSMPVHLAASAGLILCLTRENGLLAKLLASRSMVYLGEVSYSLYMCHWLVMLTLIGVVRWNGGEAPFLWAGVLIGSQLAAIALYHFVELPGRRLIRKISFEREPRKAAASAPSAVDVVSRQEAGS